VLRARVIVLWAVIAVAATGCTQSQLVAVDDPPFNARAALDRYLEALARRDATVVAETSTGGASAIATVVKFVADLNATAKGKTTIRVGGESFQVTEETPDHVTFAGSVHVVTDVKGPRGPTQSDVIISGPVTVALTNGAWRVKSFIYAGKPLLYVPENAANGHDGMTVVVEFVLSYGDVTNAVIRLSASGAALDPRLALQDAHLITPGTTVQRTSVSFVPGPGPRGLVAFPRTDRTPTQLDVVFRRPNGQTVSYSVPLTGVAA